MDEKWIVYKILTPAGRLWAVNYCSEAVWHESVKNANMVTVEKVSEHTTEKEAIEIALLIGLTSDSSPTA